MNHQKTEFTNFLSQNCEQTQNVHQGMFLSREYLPGLMPVILLKVVWK